ncbi:MAG: hypothetical protein KKE95_06710 [Gammaproteobacteria bacterium]|nr:hypothetical protein [Gammaproteobacteria bacterium]MBU0817179.1 hypothetical protein [Gammaproteobacteria bacterium]
MRNSEKLRTTLPFCERPGPLQQFDDERADLKRHLSQQLVEHLKLYQPAWEGHAGDPQLALACESARESLNQMTLTCSNKRRTLVISCEGIRRTGHAVPAVK